MTKLPAVEFAERSDPGRDPTKQVNEDTCRYGETPLGHLAVTCDGMGGHEGGREASTIAVATIFETVLGASPDASPPETLRRALELANQKVFGLAAKGHEASRPGSTVVAVLLHAGGAEIAHVGDSRVYLLHGEGVEQITHDHSMVQQMVDAGLITQEEAAHHPNANQISRALGMQADVEVEVRRGPVPYVTGDVFILCSDGLCDLVGKDDMLRIVGSAPVAQAAGQLVDLANARGGHDNITVQLLRAKESAIVLPGSGVAPTVVDAVSKTVVDESPRTTEVPGAIRATPPAPVKTTTDPPPGRSSPVLAVGLLLAAVGIAIAGAAFYFSLQHKKHPVPAFVAEDAAPAALPSATLEGGAKVEVAEPSPAPSSSEATDAAPLAPLVAPDAGVPHLHRRPPPVPTAPPPAP